MRVVLWSLSASLLLAPAISFAKDSYDDVAKYDYEEKVEVEKIDRTLDRDASSKEPKVVIAKPPSSTTPDSDVVSEQPVEPIEDPYPRNLLVGERMPEEGDNVWVTSSSYTSIPTGYQNSTAPSTSPGQVELQEEMYVPSDLTEQTTELSLQKPRYDDAIEAKLSAAEIAVR